MLGKHWWWSQFQPSPVRRARRFGNTATVRWPAVPLHPDVAGLARRGFITGASQRNWAGYGADVDMDTALPPEAQALLSDPQTSGGLLVSCAAERAASILQTITAAGFPAARIIGHTEAGKPSIKVA